MAQKKRDFLDELIDIQSDWSALSRTGDDLVGQFVDDPSEAPVYDPADYKERPRANSTYCVTTVLKNPEACSRCTDVCPVNAIAISGATVRIGEECRKCGLCSAVCPTEVFQVRKIGSMALYDQVARVAAAYEQCYVTCTRALGRLPKDNEVLLPCVGAMSRELWFDLLCDFPNISVYLPLGICDRCRTTTGEETFSDAIAEAEEWSGESVGLEVDERDLVREQKRAYKRSQFVSGMTQAGTRLVSRGMPALAGAQAVAKRLQDHSRQITSMQVALEKAVGAQSAQKRRRILTRNRRLLMAGLQKYPDLADEIILSFPEVDVDLCTMCGDCAKACTVRALEISKEGRVTVEPPYCVNCGACKVACPEGAISLTNKTAEELVVPDEKAEERERQRARAARLKKKGEKGLKAGLDALEKLANEDE